MKLPNSIKGGGLSKKLAIIFLALLIIDFILFKIFGEPYKGGYSFGHSLFTAWSIITLLAFLGMIGSFIADLIYSCKKRGERSD